jgi:hypothetical protein
VTMHRKNVLYIMIGGRMGGRGRQMVSCQASGLPRIKKEIEINKEVKSSVSIATGWTAQVRFPAAQNFSSPQRPDRLWGLPRLLFDGYHGLLSRG